jgi:hypothetical protein
MAWVTKGLLAAAVGFGAFAMAAIEAQAQRLVTTQKLSASANEAVAYMQCCRTAGCARSRCPRSRMLAARQACAAARYAEPGEGDAEKG